jgi:hypothetical protein
MKPTTFATARILLALLIACITLGLVSWDGKKAPGKHKQQFIDTIPQKEKKIRDLDDVLDELNNAEMKVNMEKMQKELQEAMKNVDASKIKAELEKELAMVNVEKMKKELDASIAKIDAEKIKESISKVMNEVDAAKIKEQVEASISKVDWEKMKKELDEVQKIDMSKMQSELDKVQEEMKKLGPQLEKEMQHAKVEIEKAKVEMKEYKDFVDGLANDGLINKKEPYSIKHKDGELTVNGKKVSGDTYNKYRAFLEKHKTFTIEKSADDFNIDVD